MNLRQNSLLKRLIQTEYFKPIRDYCQTLNCSEKTIRMDIQTINSFLGEHQFKTAVRSIQGRGVKMELVPNEKELLLGLLDAELLDTLPDLRRFYQGVLTLLLSGEDYTIDSLAEALYSNSVQIKEALRRWDNMLYLFHLKLVKKQNLEIQGREEDIRLFVLYYFYLLAEKAMTDRIEPLLIGGNRLLFCRILSMLEREQGHCFTGNTLHQFEFYLAILVRRVRLGRGIMLSGKVPSHPYGEIRELLEDSFPIKVPLGELCFLKKMAESGGKRWSDHLFSSFGSSSPSAAMTEAFLRALEARYARSVPSDLRAAFYVLMETALRRKKNGLLVLNYEGNQIKEEYLREYLMVTRIFFDTPFLKKCGFNEMEYARFTMLLLPYFQEMKLVYRYRAGLIVNCSIEQACFGKYKIEQSLPGILIVQTLTEEEIEKSEHNLDFLIAFHSVSCSLPHVEITSMVKREDIAELSAFLDRFDEDVIKHKKFDLPRRRGSIREVYYPDIIKLLYRDMQSEEAGDLSYEEYEQRLMIQKVIKQDQLLILFYDSSVKKQLMFSYEMEKKTYIDGRIIRNIHVLYLKDWDELELAQVIRKLGD